MNDSNIDEGNILSDPKRIAHRIASTVKESLEQGESGIFDNITGGEIVGFDDTNNVKITSKKQHRLVEVESEIEAEGFCINSLFHSVHNLILHVLLFF